MKVNRLIITLPEMKRNGLRGTKAANIRIIKIKGTQVKRNGLEIHYYSQAVYHFSPWGSETWFEKNVAISGLN